MRFLLITQDLEIGGAQRAIVELGKKLVINGDEVFLLTLAKDNKKFFDIDDRIKVISLEEDSKRNVFIKNIARAYQLRNIVKVLNVDKVISFLEHINILTIFSLLGIKSDVSVCIRNDPRRKRMSSFHEFLRRITYPLSSHLVVQTESVKEWANSLGLNKNIKVIPNFVRKLDLVKSNYEIGNTFKIVAIGRLVDQKGYDLLLKALSLLSNEMCPYSLEIYGEGNLLEKLKGQRESLGIVDKVSFVGVATEVNRILVEADLFVLPSRYEGYPNILVEALSSGTPSVVFDCPSGPREITLSGKLALLVEDGNVEKLAEAIERTYKSTELRKKLGHSAIEHFSDFDNSSILKLWMN